MTMKNSALWGPYETSPALDTLTAECDKAWPNRGRELDGNIGDKYHRYPSGHLPDHSDGNMLHAEDLTARGLDPQTVIRRFMADARAYYAIHKGVIWSITTGGNASTYHGDNPHEKHIHLQVRAGSWARSTASWGIWTPTTQPPAPSTPGGRELFLTKPRMVGEDVRYVQRYIGPEKCGKADGVYGPNTERGVRWYQGMRGIRVTGHVDALTWVHLLGRAGR